MSAWPSSEVLAVLRLVHCQWNKSRMKRSLNFRLKIAQKRSAFFTCTCCYLLVRSRCHYHVAVQVSLCGRSSFLSRCAYVMDYLWTVSNHKFLMILVCMQRAVFMIMLRDCSFLFFVKRSACKTVQFGNTGFWVEHWQLWFLSAFQSALSL